MVYLHNKPQFTWAPASTKVGVGCTCLYHKQKGAAPNPGPCKHCLQNDGKPDEQLGVRVGIWNVGSTAKVLVWRGRIPWMERDGEWELERIYYNNIYQKSKQNETKYYQFWIKIWNYSIIATTINILNHYHWKEAAWLSGQSWEFEYGRTGFKSPTRTIEWIYPPWY